jgi:nitrite reductase/ring-hydroxylating ferredoxin subunit
MNATGSKKPLWNEEFSVHVSEDRYVLRRQFMKFLTLVSFGMLTGNAWIWLRSVWGRPQTSFPRMTIGPAAEVPVGGVRLFNYPGPHDPCILVRTAADKYVAYSQKCTHLSCAVYYSNQNRRLECPCHEGYFSIEDGRVLQGPPPRPLPGIALEERGGQLIALGVIAGGEER